MIIPLLTTQAGGAVEYTDCNYSRKGGKNPLPPNECFGYDIKPSDCETPVCGALGNVEYLFIAIAPRFTRTQNGSTW